MGLDPFSWAAIASAVTGGLSLVKGISDRNAANKNARRAEDEQKKARSETQAQNAAKAAEERRAQVREERVRRARIMQSSENTGVSESSGEFGAIGTLGTNLGVNLGINQGRLASASRQSDYLQTAADFSGKASQNLSDAQTADSIFNLSTNIFSASGGVNQIKNDPGVKSIFTPSSTGGLWS